MLRLILTSIFVAYTVISVGPALAQNGLPDLGGTVRGQVTDLTETRDPIEGVNIVIVAAVDGTEYTTTSNINGDYERSGIPAGRYFISIYKDGYGDRLGKPVVVVNGGDHYVPLNMTKNYNIATFIREFGFLFWIIFFCAITALLTFLFTKRAMTQKFESNQRR